MTWTKLGQEFITDPTMLGVPRGARLLHIEATIWSNMHGTDGAVPTHVLTRITDELDIERAVEHLVTAGLWQAIDGGWTLLDFADTQRAAEDVERVRRRNAERQRRYRQHSSGDHSLCDSRYCRSAVTDAVSNRVSNDACTDLSRTDLSRKGSGSGTAKDKTVGADPARPDGRPVTPTGPTMSRGADAAERIARRLALYDRLEGKA